MQFIFLFLIVFCISKSHSDVVDGMRDFYLRVGKEEAKKSIYPRYEFRHPNDLRPYNNGVSGYFIYFPNDLRLYNDSVSAYFAYLLTEDSSLFENKFPSTTVEEINHVLNILGLWVRYQRNALDRANVWGFDPFPMENINAVEEEKEMYIKQILAFEEKINQLREKRKKFYPPKKSLMSRCALLFSFSKT